MTRAHASLAVVLLLAGGAAEAAAVAPSSPWRAVEVPGGADALARAAGVVGDFEEWRLIDEVVRRIYSGFGEKGRDPRAEEALRAHLAAARSAPSRDVAPLPLAPATWRALLRRQVPDRQLLSAILAERSAALLYRGLLRVDGPTLGFLESQPELLALIKSSGAEAFSVFGRSLRIRDGRVLTPGGEAAARLWAAAVHASPDEPRRFVPALLARDSGRIAFLYDAVARLDPPHQRFATGLWIPDARAREQRFLALLRLAAQADAWWSAEPKVGQRGLRDLRQVLARPRVAESGAPQRPAARLLWEAAFAAASLGSAGPLPEAGGRHEAEPFDAAWLVQRIALVAEETGHARLDAISFGQRVLGASDDDGDVAVTLAGFDRYRSLLVAFERLGARDPAFYARAVRRLERQSRGHDETTLAQLQGTLAIVFGARRAGTLSVPAAMSLAASLLDLQPTHGSYRGQLAGWLDRVLLPELAGALGARALSAEELLARALAGVTVEPRMLEWNGLRYQLDPVAATLSRIRRARAGASQPLDDVLALRRAAAAPHDRTSGSLAAGDVAEPASLRHADELLAAALVSWAYVAQLVPLGEPLASAAGMLADRHELVRPAHRRASAPWSPPVVLVGRGEPWHLHGSLLGLDLGIAPFGLQRALEELPARPPVLGAREAQSFAEGVVLLQDQQQTDAQQDAIAAAVARGRSRAEQLHRDSIALDRAAQELGLEAWRENALRWDLDRGVPLERELSLLELFWLGRPELDVAARNAWGAPQLTADGCPCLRLPAPPARDEQLPEATGERLAAQVPDLSLRVAEWLSGLRLPARLAPSLVGLAVRDLLDSAQPIRPSDVASLVRHARELAPERLEDYLSASVVTGPLLPMTPKDAKGR